jgi:hypothetical protein
MISPVDLSNFQVTSPGHLKFAPPIGQVNFSNFQIISPVDLRGSQMISPIDLSNFQVISPDHLKFSPPRGPTNDDPRIFKTKNFTTYKSHQIELTIILSDSSTMSAIPPLFHTIPIKLSNSRDFLMYINPRPTEIKVRSKTNSLSFIYNTKCSPNDSAMKEPAYPRSLHSVSKTFTSYGSQSQKPLFY